MLNRTNILIAILISGIALSSCSSKISLTKRRYTKGYYFDVAKNKKAPKSETIEEKKGIAAITPADKSPKRNSDASLQQQKAGIIKKGNPVSTLHTEVFDQRSLTASSVKARKNNTTVNHTKPQLHASFVKMQAKKHASKAEQNHSKVPYEFFGSGSGVLVYIFGAFISILFSFLFMLLIFAILDGLFPAWLLSFLVFLLVIAIIAIIAVIILNSD